MAIARASVKPVPIPTIATAKPKKRVPTPLWNRISWFQSEELVSKPKFATHMIPCSCSRVDIHSSHFFLTPSSHSTHQKMANRIIKKIFLLSVAEKIAERSLGEIVPYVNIITEITLPIVYTNQNCSQLHSGTQAVQRRGCSLIGRFHEELQNPAKTGRMSPSTTEESTISREEGRSQLVDFDESK